MSEHSMHAGWAPGRAVRLAIGAFAGIGAVGISGGLGLAGTYLDVGRPVIDPSGLILMAPVVAIPGFAAALLRGPGVIISIMVGAFVAPIVAIFAIDGSCEANMFAAIGLFVSAFYALLLAGVAAFVGDRIGGHSRLIVQHGGRGVAALVAVSVIGTLAWIAAVATLGRCP